jgi:hypothetical protein
METFMTDSSNQGNIHTLYGPALTEAINSGDTTKMAAMREAAFDYIGKSSEVAKLLPKLEQAMKDKGHPIRPLYAVTIQEAVARGDEAELSRLKGEVGYYANLLHGDTAANLPIPPYGVAIQDAKNRGDQAELQRLTAWAQSLLDQLNTPN